MGSSERKTLVRNENYIVIQGWMVSDLGLKGNELMIYAIVYGFSQLEGQRFTGSLQYLADWTNSTKQGVMKCLRSLEAKGLIEKRETFVNRVKFCEYFASGAVNKVSYPMQQSLTGGMQQSSPNNLERDTLEENIDDKNDRCDKGEALPSDPLESFKKILRETPEAMEWMDSVIAEETDRRARDSMMPILAEDARETTPTAFTRRLIASGYIAEGDLEIGEYNRFFAGLVAECGDWTLVRNSVNYFAKACGEEMRKGITNRLAYAKESIAQGVRTQIHRAEVAERMEAFEERMRKMAREGVRS